MGQLNRQSLHFISCLRFPVQVSSGSIAAIWIRRWFAVAPSHRFGARDTVLNIGQIFTAESQSIYDFLTVDGQGCYIPSYQRGYAWDAQNVARLLEDATLGLERLMYDRTSVRFIGSIIAVPGNNRELAPPPLDRELPTRVLTIIDGQQRLCTIVMFNILIHDKLRNLVAQLDHGEEDALVAIVNETRDYLDDLAKSYMFEGRRAAHLNRLYPRLVRSMDDVWARSPDIARYCSPIARFTWAYVEHTEAVDAEIGEFEYDATNEDGDLVEGHEPLLAVIAYLREQIDLLSLQTHDLLRLPEVRVIIAEDSTIASELWPHAIPASVRAYFADDAEDAPYETAQQIIRLLALSRFVNARMAATVIDASEEDYAFDMFEALNTTGQPLTAFETFKPKVIEAEGIAEYPRSPSRRDMDIVQAFLDRFKKAEERQAQTSTLLIPFALSENGHKLEKHLSHQRRYLRDQFAAADTTVKKRRFVKNLATTATFVDLAWRPRSQQEPQLLPGDAYRDRVAGFCFEALRTLRHDIVLAPLSRFYSAFSEANAAARPAAAEEYFAAIKAITAFSMLWRASKGGTANIDSVYRELMARGIGGIGALARQSGHAPTAENLRRALRAKLDAEGLDRDTWIRNASQAAIYKTGQNVTRFLLIAASQNAVPDEDEPGLIVKGRRGVLELLNRDWDGDDLQTIEHVAPVSANSRGWPTDVYRDQRTVHRLGNFVLMPSLENDVLANRPWAEKRVLYQMFGASTLQAARQAMEDARAVGFNADGRARDLVENSSVLPMCRAISAFEGRWNLAFIERRSTRLAELAWDTIIPWLSPPAVRQRRRRRA